MALRRIVLLASGTGAMSGSVVLERITARTKALTLALMGWLEMRGQHYWNIDAFVFSPYRSLFRIVGIGYFHRQLLRTDFMSAKFILYRNRSEVVISSLVRACLVSGCVAAV